ncbi:formin-like protein 6 [Iris pallida]|uniref:Formin-like protein 6 n=1 Tax=Iris pallida TaxID=29817 RepID=A0AAX6GTR8_IRIPA|nr:formin-like protein 6 [Iris pallida]
MGKNITERRGKGGRGGSPFEKSGSGGASRAQAVADVAGVGAMLEEGCDASQRHPRCHGGEERRHLHQERSLGGAGGAEFGDSGGRCPGEWTQMVRAREIGDDGSRARGALWIRRRSRRSSRLAWGNAWQRLMAMVRRGWSAVLTSMRRQGGEGSHHGRGPLWAAGRHQF